MSDHNDLLKHIQLGTDEVFYYPYSHGQEPLPLRPLSSVEEDDCFYKALEGSPRKIAEFVVKIRTQTIKPQANIDLDNKALAKLQKFHDLIDYWVVYHAMKDFQDDEFQYPAFNEPEEYPKGFYAVRKMNDVHKIANKVLNASDQPKDVIKETIETPSGKEAAIIFHYFNQPLAKKIGDLTKAQKKFIIYSKGELKKMKKDAEISRKYSISGKTMTLGEFLGKA